MTSIPDHAVAPLSNAGMLRVHIHIMEADGEHLHRLRFSVDYEALEPPGGSSNPAEHPALSQLFTGSHVHGQDGNKCGVHELGATMTAPSAPSERAVVDMNVELNADDANIMKHLLVQKLSSHHYRLLREFVGRWIIGGPRK